MKDHASSKRSPTRVWGSASDALDARQANEEDHAKKYEDDDADEHVTLAVGRGLQRSVLIG